MTHYGYSDTAETTPGARAGAGAGPGSARGRHGSGRRRQRPPRRGWVFRALALVLTLAVVFALVVVIMFAWGSRSHHHRTVSWGPRHPIVITLPARATSYIGAYVHGVPQSYAPVESFAAANRVQPNIALYYSGWGESFRSAFARQAASHQAVPMVQIDPGSTSLADIADGYYDKYLRSYAKAVGNFGAETGQGVIIGFGHEPNGYWYPWGYKHVKPRLWIAAWRHIVTVFRQQGADDVTWLWTVNIIERAQGIISPAKWWPGGKYVTWVGIDGYYHVPAQRFAALFGPVIKVIRNLTVDPILISETGALPRAGKVAKIADEFRGIRAYGLLGLVWFDVRAWRLDTKAASAAFASAAKHFAPLAR
jgi:mannan endo-1,4-beta-mannosidase